VTLHGVKYDSECLWGSADWLARGIEESLETLSHTYMDEHDTDPEHHKTIYADDDCLQRVRAYRWVHHYKYFLCRKVYKILRDKFGLKVDKDDDETKEAKVLELVQDKPLIAELKRGFWKATLELDRSRHITSYRDFDRDICVVYR
jgi:hypothetical protein